MLLRIKRSENYDASFLRVLSAYILLNALNLSVAFVAKNAVILNNRTFMAGFVFLIVLFFERAFFRRALTRCIVLEIVFALLMFVSFALYPDKKVAIFNRMIWTFTFCIPLCSMAFYVKDQIWVVENLYKVSVLVLICGIVVFIARFLVNDNRSYLMSMGYMLLLPTMVFFHKAFQRTGNVLLFLTGFLLIVLCGSRGPLLSIGIYMIYELLWYKAETGNKKIKKYFFLILAVCAVLNFDEIIDLLTRVMKSLNLSSRTLTLYRTEKILSDSGRGALSDMTWGKILEKPMLGWGVCGEFGFTDVYPHNLILELCTDYGLIIGLGIFAILAICSARKLIIHKFSDSAISMFLCAGMVPLFLSASYLTEALFWVLFSFCTAKEKQQIHDINIMLNDEEKCRFSQREKGVSVP